MMADRLISEQAVMESLTKEYNHRRTGDGLKLAWIEKAVSATPTASDWDRYSTALWREAYERGKRDGQPEPLTDKEQRIFLAAMGREEEVCEEVDRDYVREPYEDSLMSVCREIKRKVKGALWT